MISQRAKYALRALVALARAEADQTIMISELSTSCVIPKKFLEQILLDLKHHDLVRSRRGKLGGYQLNKQPTEIMFGEVLRIVDGPIALLPCLSVTSYRRCKDCSDEASCEIRRVFAQVAKSSRDILDNTSLSDAMTVDRQQRKPASRKRDARETRSVRSC
ncbi:MAG: Rrf2 family transcriptional regulator [Rhodospirillales bacterium]|nr:Rrf2 family transcriptional regulator [Rhodospirillales bacterium]